MAGEQRYKIPVLLDQDGVYILHDHHVCAERIEEEPGYSVHERSHDTADPGDDAFKDPVKQDLSPPFLPDRESLAHVLAAGDKGLQIGNDKAQGVQNDPRHNNAFEPARRWLREIMRTIRAMLAIVTATIVEIATI